MFRKKGIPAVLTALCLMLLLSSCFGLGKRQAFINTKTLTVGESWSISETTSMKELILAKGSSIRPPEGQTLTMTVNGVETGLLPGTYRGDIVLTLAENIPASQNGAVFARRSAITIENGKYAPQKSVPAAATGATITDMVAKDVKVTSVGDNFNGIIVRGDTAPKYTIMDPVIKLTGNGENDFAGVGAGILCEGNANLTVRRGSIITKGVARPAVVVRENGVLHVTDAVIETYNGTSDDKKTSAPWGLGIAGNARAGNIIGNGTAEFENTKLKAQGWGVFSTEATGKVKLSATRCSIETVESGFGAHAVGDCTDTFSQCTFRVQDYGMILGEKSPTGIFTDGTVVNSLKVGVMVHAGSTGNLVIEKNSVFNTRKAAIQVKSAFPSILVDGAQLHPESGIILQAIEDDNPDRKDIPDPKNEIVAVFKNATLNGDIVSSMTNRGDLRVTLDNAVFTGVITTAIARPMPEMAGLPLSKEKYQYVGEVRHTYRATPDPYGVAVTVENNATWVVDETSYLTELTLAAGVIRTPSGHRLTLVVDGKETPLEKGTYHGKIVLRVSRG